MKKITLLAALLGSMYVANAQVGIGTPKPNKSAELDIVSTNKGVLIPRVELTSLTTFGMAGNNASDSTSLLIFNNTATTDIPLGFYYWENSKWNRIINKTDLDTVITNTTNIEGDVTKLKEAMNKILPTYPGNPATDVANSPSAVVYHDGVFSVVTYVDDTYKIDPINLNDLVASFETITLMVPLETNGKITGYTYYNEAVIKKAAKDGVDLSSSLEGAITIDVKGVVVNNFQEIVKSGVTITEGNKTFSTVAEYLQYISQFSEGNVIYTNIGTADAPKMGFQYYDGTNYTTIDLSNFEKETNIKRSITTTNGEIATYNAVEAPTAANVLKGEVYYQYKNEKDVAEYINITQDVLTSIENNVAVQTAISNILNTGGTVFYGKLNDSDTENVLYQYVGNVKTKIELNYDITGVAVSTGNKVDGKLIYMFKSTTNVVEAGESVMSPITLPTSITIEGIKSIQLLNAAGNFVTSAVTDVEINLSKIEFNIGIGKMYTVLPKLASGSYTAIVEFVGTPVTP